MVNVHQIDNVEISGIIACVPKQRVNTRDYSLMTEEEVNKFIRITGIEEKRIAPKNITALDLSVQAVNTLLKSMDICPKDIDIIIVVCQTRDYIFPQMANLIQDKCGLRQQIMAFDIPAGCAGYNIGMSVLGTFIQTGKYKKGILVCSDTTSKTTFYEDKAYYPILGDAGTATLLTYNEHASPIFYQHFSDGNGAGHLIILGGGFRNGWDEHLFDMIKYEDGIDRPANKVYINGAKIFEFAVNVIPKFIDTFLELLDLKKENIDYFVLHQANKIINETIRKQMKLEADKFPSSIEYFGNTSGASVPLTIVYKLRDILSKKNNKLLLCGFGVGLSWSNMIIETKSIYIGKIEEI